MTKISRVSIPSLITFVVLLTGCDRPHLWEYTFLKPSEADLVGEYSVVRYNGDFHSIAGFSISDPIRLVLSPDHTAEGSFLPEFDGFGDLVVCKLSGNANWKIDRGIGWQDLILHFKSVPKSNLSEPIRSVIECRNDWSVTVLGHHSPHSFYLSVGDPSENKGIEFIRTSR